MKVFADGPWTRPAKIILGVDIGTTQSAVSFAYLYPGGPQALHRVTAWPGQKSQKEESKIPTLIYYDGDNAVSFGAEALKPSTVETAQDENWGVARHFKIHLHPESMKQKHNLEAQPLPANITLFKIYTDFMVYLLKHTRKFFESRIIEGERVWNELHKDMTIVLAHPNGWGFREQNFLRKATVAAQLVPSDKAISQIRFVSEAEASVHFCMFHGDLYNRFKADTTFIVCDAGGSTIDTTAYSVRSAFPMLELEEKKASACVQAGGIYIDAEFETYLTRILNGIDELHYDERIDYIREGVNDFEGMAKREFENVDSEHRVGLGAGRLTIPALRIRRGAITLDDKTIKPFFDNCVTQVVTSVRQQMSGLSCKHVLLVGGFGDSLYLRKVLVSEFSKNGCTVNIANDSTAKAVSDGAVIWCAKLSVISRASRMSYGVEVKEKYDPQKIDHSGRTVFKDDTGYDYVGGKWSQIIDKGVVMDSEGAVRRRFWYSSDTALPHAGDFTITIFAFTGDKESPNNWVRNKAGRINKNFEKICEVTADLNNMRQTFTKETGPGGDYWHLTFNIALQFGGTELQAFVEWVQDGVTHVGPASILPGALINVQV